jgi:ferredoxin-NADP reductase
MRSGLGTPVRIVAMRYEAAGVHSFFLRRVDGADLSPVEPGAHVDIRLPNEAERSYSLSNNLLLEPATRGSYRITVARDPQSKGASAFLHDVIRLGEIVMVSEPRNNFPLHLDADLSVFIAGGIGITPVVPMAATLTAAGREWRLLYTAKTREHAAFLGEIEALAGMGTGRVTCFLTRESGGERLDVARAVADLPPDAHVYCCGPTRMLQDFRGAAATQGIESSRIHYEFFKSDGEVADRGGFTVVLQRSGRELRIKPGQTILEAVEAVGCDVPYSCREGICGECETRVLNGTPDHRDMLLSEEERRTATTMMICCSGATSDRLVLDL